MKKFLIGFMLSAMCLAWGLFADMPGATTYGKQTRVNGRIVNQPYSNVAQPYYYGGNLVYPNRGAAYRSPGGKIQYQTNYTQYGYRNPGINYNFEAERLRDEARRQDQQSPYNQPYNAPQGYTPQPGQGY